MRNLISQMSLRWKLASVTVLATTLALVLSGVVMVIYNARTYEAQKVGAITSEAEILAASITAALTFDDTYAALEYLGALDANPEIVVAAAYNAAGDLVASHARPDNGSRKTWVAPEKAEVRGHLFEGDELSVFVPVRQGDEVVGSVYIKASVEPVVARMARALTILLTIGALALAVTMPIALWLHRLISNPIEELKARTAIIRTTLDSVDHGLIVVDGNMTVTFINDRICEMLGIPAPTAREGVSFDETMRNFRAKSGMRVDNFEADLKRAKSNAHLRDQYLLPDGRAIECRQSPIATGGFVRSYTDISEEKKLQTELEQARVRAEDAALAKSQFLAAMSHEIRTPMSGVIGIVELLHATELNSEQRQMVDLIRRSGLGLLDVINDILDYSKIEAGRMTVEEVAFVLSEVVETTAEVIGGHTQSKTLNIVCSIDPDIDYVVKGDPVRIRQIILNLMGNAVKFTEKGTVAINVTAESQSGDRIAVLFEITDTGMGIEKDAQEKLFQAFSQADYSTTRKFGGTGLGLSISKNLVALMGGEIGVRSAPGEGSTFWFRIPFLRLPAEGQHNPFSGYGEVLKGLRVMIYDAVGDSAAARYLRAAGLDVVECGDPAETMRRLKDDDAAGRPFDVVVAGVRVGEEDATCLIDDINACADLRQLKTVLIVPHLSGSAARRASAQKLSGLLPAPIQRLKLYETIAAATGRAHIGARTAEDGFNLNFIAPSVDEAKDAGCLILVAEDNQTNQFVIRNQLRRLGFAAEFVNDGREAWEVLNKPDARYGMLITDCHMPFVDGYQLTGLIRDRELGSSRRLPVVALTANALQGEADICRAAGMDAYLSKPTNLATLDAMIQRWLPEAAGMRRPSGVVEPPAVSAPIAREEPATRAVDTSVLAHLLGTSDPKQLRDMLDMYLETESDVPAALQKIIAARDGVALAQAAHAAKGAAASAGAQRLADIYKELEHGGKKEDWATVERLAAHVDPAFEDVRKFIKAL